MGFSGCRFSDGVRSVVLRGAREQVELRCDEEFRCDFHACAASSAEGKGFAETGSLLLGRCLVAVVGVHAFHSGFLLELLSL